MNKRKIEEEKCGYMERKRGWVREKEKKEGSKVKE